ncbi:MAG: tRNA pseudouridine(38-40) synthase TruA [Lachnotalea sp.]
MRNIMISIQYDGSRYKGWKKQKNNEFTVQGKIEGVLTKMTGVDTEVIGSEGMAVGVHAENYIANFHTDCDLSIDKMSNYLYEYLPTDIVVKSMKEVDERFHSRYNPKSKTYVYKINNNKLRNVFERKYVYHISEKLNLDKMKTVAEVLKGTHDFQSFHTLTANTKSTTRTINYINITEDNGRIEIEINANEFMLNMARVIVATIIEAGQGKIKLQDVEKLLSEKRESEYIPMAKTKGLYLRSVQY